MPIPLKPGENIYIDHKVKSGSYAMPCMQTSYDHYSIGYSLSGDRKWYSYNLVAISHAGNIGFQRPGIPHQNLPLSDAPYDRYLIKYRKEVIQPVIDLIGENGFHSLHINFMSFKKEDEVIIRTQFEDMLNEYEKNSRYSQFILQGMLERLILTIYEKKLPLQSNDVNQASYDPRIHNSILYIESHISEDLSLHDIAAHVALAPTYFSKLFHQVTGNSLSSYIRLSRLQHAQILLGSTSMSVGEIAVACGFDNGNYMCNVFKKQFHLSPNEYRKQKIHSMTNMKLL